MSRSSNTRLLEPKELQTLALRGLCRFRQSMKKSKNRLKTQLDTLGDRWCWYSGAGLYRGVRLLVDNAVHFAPWGVAVASELDGDNAMLAVRAKIESRFTGARYVVVHAALA